MLNLHKKLLLSGLLGIAGLGIVGCAHNRPADYADRRPPIDSTDPRDSGLQSKDVVASTDQLAMDLLSIPEVTRNPNRLTMVVSNVENRSADPRFNYDIFVERLRVKLSEHGRDRIALIENRDKLRDLQSRELDSPRDTFGQGGRGGGPNGIQPDFALYGKIYEMPNRATSYYFCQFNVVDLRSREQIWSRSYEVKAER